jgi:PAS domain S-box-containing protein
MPGNRRPTGIDTVGNVPWGTHLCQFYRSKQDLRDILVPYFRAGLENNEYCLWVTADVLDKNEAERAIRKAMPDYDWSSNKGQIEIVPYNDWYCRDGVLDLPSVIDKWLEKHQRVKIDGYEGLRVAADVTLAMMYYSEYLLEYEEAIDNTIGDYRIIALCSYQVDKCEISELVDIVSKHQLALIRRGGRWVGIESAERKRAQEALKRVYSELAKRFEERTTELARANKALQREVQERIQVEEALRKERDRAQQYLDVAGVVFLAIDTDGRVTLINKKGCEVLGYPEEEIIGKDWFENFIPTRLIEEVRSVYQKLLSGDIETLEYYENPILTRSGEERTIAWHNVTLRGETIDIIGRLSSGEDITERKLAEEALVDSEERYSSLVDNIKLGIFRSTPGPEGHFLEVNRGMEELTGYSRNELLTMDVTNLYVYPEQRVAIMKEAANGAGKVTRELNMRKKDGTEMVVFDTKFTVRDETGKIAYFDGVLEDITERKQIEKERSELEQKAQLASRLASIGQMASGVAHEINNPVASIIGFADLLLERDIPSDIRDDIDVIHSEAERVAGIVSKLLAFARRREPEMEYVNINDVVQTAVDLRFNELETNNVTISTLFDSDLPWTMADSNQLQQVFLNLIINAEIELKQIKRNGKLTIKTETKDGNIRISFTDNGYGIPEENIEKIFEPFFTTRKKDEGTGLGLSVCHGIMVDHKGTINAKNEPGGGATFIVELPIVEGGRQIEMPESILEEAIPVTAANILVVDDEPAVLKFLCRTLRGQGYNVDGVQNASEVLLKFQNDGYDLILLDIKLPGMSGIDLYKHMQKKEPLLAKKVVFITGDVMGGNTRSFLSRTKAHYIVKPFSAGQLRREVNGILAARVKTETNN